ncbi:MAG: ubiquinol-cytochrome c reductase iron-sulfur subunit [Stygiobacter sp.]
MNDKTQNKIPRKNFLKHLINISSGAFVLMVIYPIISFLKPPKQRELEVSNVKISNLDDFAVGDSRIVRFGNKPVLVIHKEKEHFIALSAACTHLDCTVQYKKDESVIWCACHNGKYDLTGRNISGPPPRPLDKFVATLKNNELIITKAAS